MASGKWKPRGVHELLPGDFTKHLMKFLTESCGQTLVRLAQNVPGQAAERSALVATHSNYSLLSGDDCVSDPGFSTPFRKYEKREALSFCRPPFHRCDAVLSIQ